ncbi:MAG TPA: hypothetical protein VGL82_22225 [Bryobacteraceae bacterium]|jgi:adenine specific DNA methylase Mod
MTKHQEAWTEEPPLFQKIGFCDAKRKLINDFLEAVHELTALQKQQAQAAMEDDQDFSRFDALLHLAQETKDAAKYAWIAHVESHKC